MTVLGPKQTCCAQIAGSPGCGCRNSWKTPTNATRHGDRHRQQKSFDRQTNGLNAPVIALTARAVFWLTGFSKRPLMKPTKTHATTAIPMNRLIHCKTFVTFASLEFCVRNSYYFSSDILR